MDEPLVHPVGDGAVVEQGGEHLVHRFDEVVQATNVEECFLLTRKRGIGEVLGRCRRTDSNRNVPATAHRIPERPHILHQAIGKRCFENPVADRLAGVGQRADVIDIEFIQHTSNFLVEPAGTQKVPVSGRCRRKTSGHGDAEVGEVADHFTE